MPARADCSAAKPTAPVEAPTRGGGSKILSAKWVKYFCPLTGLDGEDDNDPMTMGNGIVFINDSDLFIAGNFVTMRGFTLLESSGPSLGGVESTEPSALTTPTTPAAVEVPHGNVRNGCPSGFQWCIAKHYGTKEGGGYDFDDDKWGRYRCWNSAGQVCEFVGPGDGTNLEGVTEVFVPFNKQSKERFMVNPDSPLLRLWRGKKFMEAFDKNVQDCVKEGFCKKGTGG
jgi:hypothetical protein